MFGFKLFSGSLEDFCTNFPCSVLCKMKIPPSVGYIGRSIETKVTRLSQYLTKNIHVMFDFNPFNGCLDDFCRTFQKTTGNHDS